MLIKALDHPYTFRSMLERKVFNACKQLELEPSANYMVSFYEVDLAFPEEKIAFEIDGKAFHSSTDQKDHDARKNKFLTNRGWTVKRYPGWMAYKYPKLLGAEYILRFMKSPTEQQKDQASMVMAYFMANQEENEVGMKMLGEL